MVWLVKCFLIEAGCKGKKIFLLFPSLMTESLDFY